MKGMTITWQQSHESHEMMSHDEWTNLGLMPDLATSVSPLYGIPVNGKITILLMTDDWRKDHLETLNEFGGDLPTGSEDVTNHQRGNVIQ